MACEGPVWSCRACTLDNADVALECEVCGARRPGSWDCGACTFLNGPIAVSCTACGTPRPALKKPKKGEAWRPANHLLNMTKSQPRSREPHHIPASRRTRHTPTYGRGQFVQSACRLILGQSGTGWRNVWRVDMCCSELPSCPICLDEPSIPRVGECGHVLCLICALRHLQVSSTCPICGVSPLMSEDFRPVRLELLTAPKGGEQEWNFQLVRRSGDHIGLPNSEKSRQMPHEGDPGWRFSRRVRGDSSIHLDLIHAELHHLEADLPTDDTTSDQCIKIAIRQLQDQLMSMSNAAPQEDLKALHPLPDKQSHPMMGQAEDSRETTVVFYQSEDGQLLFLEPHLTKQLLANYGTWGALPHAVSLSPIHCVRNETLTPELQRRHRFLEHLPLGEVTFADGEVVVRSEKDSQTQVPNWKSGNRCMNDARCKNRGPKKYAGAPGRSQCSREAAYPSIVNKPQQSTASTEQPACSKCVVSTSDERSPVSGAPTIYTDSATDIPPHKGLPVKRDGWSDDDS